MVTQAYLTLIAAVGEEPGEGGELVAEYAHKAADWFANNAWLIVALPFLSVILIAAVGKRLPKKGSEIGVLNIGLAAIFSVMVLINNFIGNARVEGFTKSFDWFPFGDGLSLTFGLQLDGLTAVMFVVVTLISLMVHIYSVGYMHDDPRFTWYYTVLNLFTGSMLVLVIAPNLLQMLVGWELVGVCSYLLIGFWWEEKKNSDAAIKAFITTKTGDVPFVLGIFVLFAAAGTFDIPSLIEQAEGGELSNLVLTAGALLLFGGAIGKSAQFPLYVWLPDAMAGPTPASALIHAATMVTAGVFLVARMFPVFEVSLVAMNTIALIGAITMLMAALLAMIQDDIKRVLAYSTISQLAYMFAALGVGAGNAAIFHLYTHAWFKALLFMGAGSLIHAVHSNNMSDMGGLKKFMPITYLTFAAGTLALAGIPPFAGFWSKDEILAEAFHFGTSDAGVSSDWVALVVWVVGVITAFLTAFYMSRAFHLTFFGKFRGHGTPHESGRMMTSPLIFLGGMSVVAGLVGIPWWKDGFGTWVAVGGESKVPDANYILIVLSVAVALGGIWLGRRLYLGQPATDPLTKLGGFYRLLENKYYLDDLYMKGVVLPIRDRVSRAMYWLNQNVFDGAVNGAASGTKKLGKSVYEVLDQQIIDGAVNGAGRGARAGSARLRLVQSGDVQRYAAMLLIGVVVLTVLFTRF